MRLAAVLLVIAAGLAGCGAGPPGGGLTGAVMQYRSDIASRVVTVRLRAGADVRVERVELRPAGFTPSAPVVPGAALGAGTTTDVRVPLGVPDCRAAPAPTTALVTTEGTTETLTLADEHDAIGALHRAECAERAARDRADVTFDPVWTRSGDRLLGTVRLHRRAGTEPVSITELGGTTLFGITPAPGSRLPLTLGPSAQDISLPVRIEAARCDRHALAESKRATAFAVVTGEPPVRLTVSPQDRVPLLDFAADVCT